MEGPIKINPNEIFLIENKYVKKDDKIKELYRNLNKFKKNSLNESDYFISKVGLNNDDITKNRNNYKKSLNGEDLKRESFIDNFHSQKNSTVILNKKDLEENISVVNYLPNKEEVTSNPNQNFYKYNKNFQSTLPFKIKIKKSAVEEWKKNYNSDDSVNENKSKLKKSNVENNKNIISPKKPNENTNEMYSPYKCSLDLNKMTLLDKINLLNPPRKNENKLNVICEKKILRNFSSINHDVSKNNKKINEIKNNLTFSKIKKEENRFNNSFKEKQVNSDNSINNCNKTGTVGNLISSIFKKKNINFSLINFLKKKEKKLNNIDNNNYLLTKTSLNKSIKKNDRINKSKKDLYFFINNNDLLLQFPYEIPGLYVDISKFINDNFEKEKSIFSNKENKNYLGSSEVSKTLFLKDEKISKILSKKYNYYKYNSKEKIVEKSMNLLKYT